ncbi:MAG: hypothetical protein KDA65_03445 [Planctomycetaceae bacterium]|nr:hypothetical protein [Planctomycetaceae bacterium]
MKYGPDKEKSANAVSMLAITFVILGGVGFYLALAGVYQIDPVVFGSILGGSFLVLGIIFWFLNSYAAESAMNSGLFRFWKKDLDKNKLDWEPKKIRNYKKDELGSNAPPTAETVQEMGMGNSTWVPKGNAPKRKTKPASKPRH